MDGYFRGHDSRARRNNGHSEPTAVLDWVSQTPGDALFLSVKCLPTAIRTVMRQL
jgi:hypothetical protein